MSRRGQDNDGKTSLSLYLITFPLAKFTFLEGAKLRLTFSPGHDDSERKTIALPRTAMQKEKHV